MTSPYLIGDLKRDEGCRLRAYPDPLSSGEPWTIGFGCTGAGIGPATVWTQDEADTELVERAGALERKLASTLVWYGALAPLRQDVLVNMVFNLGLVGLLAFHNTLSFMRAGEYAKAAAGMLDSAWAHQVGARAQRLARQMATGVHQD
jgi:lysozyme